MGRPKKESTEISEAQPTSVAELQRIDARDLPSLGQLKPSPVYNTYWQFAAERQNVFFRRFEHRPRALDPRPRYPIA